METTKKTFDWLETMSAKFDEFENSNNKTSDIPAIDKLNEFIDYAIENNLINASYYAFRGTMLIFGGRGILAKNDEEKSSNLEIAKEDFERAIEFEHANPDWYALKALSNEFLSNYENAITDYSKAIELEPKTAHYYARRAELLLGQANRKSVTNDSIDDYKRSLDDYSTAIELEPKKAKWLLNRGDVHLKIDDFDSAIADYSRAINIEEKDFFGYAKRAIAFLKKGNYEQALKDCNRGIELNPEKADCYLIRAISFREKGIESDFVTDFHKAIELSKSCYLFYYLVFYWYAKAEYQKIISLTNKFDKWERFYKWGNNWGNLKIDPYLVIDPNAKYDDIAKERVLAAIGSSHYRSGDYETAVQFLDRAFEYPVVNVNYEFIEPSEAWEKLSENRVLKAKIEERNRIIADLSHSIKNLIATVIDPLQIMKQDSTANPQIIDNALRGANLIREIVNAMNLSFKGSLSDFQYDARHNTDASAMSIADIILESIKHSVGNMFDGKYFGKFMRKYFPSREIYSLARAEWDKTSNCDTLADISATLSAHFFNPDISIGGAEIYVMGNEKGSAVKLLILFQEIILNAVKYASFVPREKRFIRIRFSAETSHMNFSVENPYDPDIRVKSSALGHVIIKNFGALLGTEPVIKTENSVYSVSLGFQNFWEKENL